LVDQHAWLCVVLVVADAVGDEVGDGWGDERHHRRLGALQIVIGVFTVAKS
jgi:hypothetical protein